MNKTMTKETAIRKLAIARNALREVSKNFGRSNAESMGGEIIEKINKMEEAIFWEQK